MLNFRNRVFNDTCVSVMSLGGSTPGYFFLLLFLSARVFRIRLSIWREVMVSVPFDLDSSPRMRSTSGSGAASLT